MLEGLIPLLSRGDTFADAAATDRSGIEFAVVDGVRVPLFSALLARRGERGQAAAALIITATGRESEAVRHALAGIRPDVETVEFPAWETLPHERLSPSAEIVGARLAALRRMRTWNAETDAPLVVVASVRGALQPVSADLADVEPVELRVGERPGELSALAMRLVDLAYARVDMVTRRGEFAVRGGILDVFPPTATHPSRIEFFGDEVDQIRLFSVADQRSLPDPVDAVALPPSREMLLTASVRQRAREMAGEFPNLSTMLEKIAEGIPVEGMESLAPALVEKLVPMTEFLPEGAAVAVFAPERVASRAASLAETNQEFLQAAWVAATAGAQAPIDLASGDYLSLADLRQANAERTWWSFTPFDPGDADPDAGVARLDATTVPRFPGAVDGAIMHVQERLTAGWTVVLTAEGTGTLDRAAQVLSERGIAARPVDGLPAEPEAGVVYLALGCVEQGFESASSRLAVLSDAEFYGRATSYAANAVKKLASRRRSVVDPLQLKPGDYVVHETHGIGRFVEMVQRELRESRPTGARRAGAAAPAATIREYLALEYAPSKRGYPGDKLYVPTDQLNQLTRYVGSEDPQLSKMGGSDWSQAKSKARRAVRDIAVELVKLYSARMASVGHSFAPDTPWQRELEEAFPYQETPDQLSTIDEVKADMERPIPMDRLISGDVGFGKTEIAVRAAFKAVQDGKQVAMIVPTTLLVKQHMETFAERFAGFPVHVRALSRFQTDREARETIEGLATGAVDVVIGTHRLLADGLVYKDLGLVIIDEEQRFGVEHKDALKKLRTNVDMLAMSATPIPRTLEMAVTGIREMSTLATPPEERHPILTFVGPRSDRQISAAIRRELLREGQIFFVHNRVTSINRVAAELSELVPEARIAVAHGQLPEAVLEQVVVDFWERKFDVLVSTTIIETGLDIANANTIIIDRADKYGLSQLHQLRGRVGRGRERAYGYFLWDDTKPLSETANDRLQTIAANNELGSGMQVALKDLEIRGAGNLLGAEQSGHIAGVGFDLYLRMIGEAVGAFRGEVAEGQTELRLELPIDAHIPEDYVDSERLRLEAYQKLSVAAAPASADDQLDLVAEELKDRYGELPAPVQHLVEVSRLRRRAQKLGLAEVVAMGRMLRIAPARLPDSKQVRLQRMYPGAKLLQGDALAVPLPQSGGEFLPDDELMAWLRDFFENIFPVAEEQSAADASA